MGGRSGGSGTGMGSRSGSKRRELSKEANDLLTLVHTGAWKGLSEKDRDEILQRVDKHADTLGETLDMYEKAGVMDALKAYQGSGYKYMNAAAIGKKTGDKKFDAEIKQHMANLDRAIQMRKTTKEMIVWRGSSKAEKNSRRYVSVSLHAAVSANGFTTGKHLHAFRIPKGTPYAYSNRIGEYEMILPRGFKLQDYKIK